MFTKKALIDSSGKVLDVLPIGMEYTPPEGTQWIPCPPEATTECEWRGGDFVRPPEPQAPVVNETEQRVTLTQKIEALTAAVEFLIKGSTEYDGSTVNNSAEVVNIIENVKKRHNRNP